MQIKKIGFLCFSAVAVAFISNTSFSAASKTEYFTVDNTQEAILGYWTPKRLRNAVPLELPAISLADDVPIPAAKNMGDHFSVSAKAPTYKMRPDFTPLFTSKKYPQPSSSESTESTESTESNDYGTDDLLFTSSRLVPLSADLTYPYSAVGKLYFTKPGVGNYVCSASVIANRIVATAGHCVYSANTAFTGYHTNLLFIPAYRDATAPYGRWTGVYSLTTPAWIASPMIPNLANQGLIEVRDNTIDTVPRMLASVVGHFGYALNKLISNHVTMLAYACNFDNCAKMHQVIAQNGPTTTFNNVKYGSDMSSGSGGGPLVQNFGMLSTGQSGGLNPARNTIVGVISWGYPNLNIMSQGASTLGAQFQNIYTSICAHRAGNC